MRPGRLRFLLCLEAFGACPPAAALPQESQRVTPLNFVFSRFATHTANTLYAGYGIGRGLVFAGIVLNPRTGYRERVLGVGAQVFPHGPNSATIALAGADATESGYLQLYVVPSLQLGQFSFSGTIELYQPLGRAGVRQLGANPVTLTLPLHRGIDAGATTLLFLEEDHAPQLGAGPALRLGIPKGSLTVDVVRGLTRFTHELRLSCYLRF